MTKILIAVPTFENIEPDCFKAIYGLERPKDTTVMFDFVRGYDVGRARNLIVQEAIDYGFDYVLMVDSDTVIPRDTLVRMKDCFRELSGKIQGSCDENVICVAGWQHRKRTTTGQTETFALNGKKNYDNECNIHSSELKAKEFIFEIKGCGMGCAMFDVKKLKTMAKSKWFEYIEYPDGGILSEDTCFCSKAREQEFKIYCDPKIFCGHVCKVQI